MNERSITYLSDAFLITCVLQKELAEDVLALCAWDRYSRTDGTAGCDH
jgi:hypothetical protein